MKPPLLHHIMIWLYVLRHSSRGMAVNAAWAIVRKKRELEQELWSGHERHEGRQGVG